MVIILHHTIVAAYLYYKDRGRFNGTHTTTAERRPKMGIPDGVQVRNVDVFCFKYNPQHGFRNVKDMGEYASNT